MKTIFRNSLTFWVFFLSALLLLATGNGYAVEEQDKKSTTVKIRAGEEKIIARDLTAATPFWCAESGRLIYLLENSEERGIFSYDVKTGKSVEIA